MDRRTVAYLAGRFRDHYRRTTPALPPDRERREWGYIPWKYGSGTTMIRHRSVVDLGEVSRFLVNEQPRHVYYSAGRYEDPAAGVMGDKGWRGADLVFDLDADHLPGVSPEDEYRTMLERCKDELFALLDLLRNDFGFEDLDIVFSGGRGYHVHVRRPDVQQLSRSGRREIADYVRGDVIELSGITASEMVAGVGRETPAEVRRFTTEGGWGKRVHRQLMARVDELVELTDAETRDALREIDGIGDRRADALASTIDASYDEIASGNIDVHPAFPRLAERILERASVEQGAAIDEPVTTDINRLIRLPGSLHGGSGLVARRIKPDTLDLFDPLDHAIPQTFRKHDIAIDVAETTDVAVGESQRTLPAGVHRVPEYVGVHLMVTERATKVPEPAG